MRRKTNTTFSEHWAGKPGQQVGHTINCGKTKRHGVYPTSVVKTVMASTMDVMEYIAAD